MLKIFLDLQRISIIKLVGEFRTVSAAFSKLRTLCLLLFCTLFCGQRQQRTRTTMLAAAAVLRPLSILSLSTTLFLNYFSASALQESRVKCRAVRQGRNSSRQTLPREGSGRGRPLTLLIDAEYIIKPVTYVTWHCQQHIRHTPNQRSQLQFMDFPAH